MSATLAKLDSNDKIIQIIPQGKSISQDKLDKIKEIYNKYGIIKVRVDTEKMDKFVLDYVSKLLKGNKKLENNLKQYLKGSIGMGSMMLSMYGLLLISEVGKIEKFIEGYDNIEHFTQVENPTSELELINAQIAEAKKKIAEQELNKPIINSEESKVINLNNSDQDQNFSPDLKSIDIIIPKVFLTTDRIKYFEILFTTFGDKNNIDSNMGFVIKQLDTVLEGLNKGSNPEIKIANIIGLMIKVSLITVIVDSFNALGENILNKEDQIQYMAAVISDLLVDFPSDTCTFYNNKLDFIKFSPNICDVKRVIQEQKCPEQICPICPVQKCPVCPVQICPEQKCPLQICPEQKCPEQKCPTCPACPEQKCPEQKCPVCNACPEQTQDSSNTWKIISIILILCVIGFLIYILWSNTNEPNLNNLAKLSNVSRPTSSSSLSRPSSLPSSSSLSRPSSLPSSSSLSSSSSSYNPSSLSSLSSLSRPTNLSRY